MQAIAAPAALIASLLISLSAALAESPAKPYKNLSVRGRVGYAADFLKEKYGVNSAPDARERVLALRTQAGEILPLVEDTRGRSFRKDERLRSMDVELLVRRYNKSPLLQVIRIYELRKDGKYELDYWCDICAIVMFELGPCDCCQGEIRLRRRKAD